MSESTTSSRKRHIIRMSAVAALALLLSACNGVWGIRGSFRNYIAGPIAHGEIEATNGATWLDGPGNGKGPFEWSIASASYNDATETGTVQFSGKVDLRGHQNAGGIFVLDTTISNPRLEIAGDEGTLYADLNFRPFEGTNPNPIPARQAALDAPFATIDLSGQDLSTGGNWREIVDAPTVGVPATMDLIGWSAFYPDGALDPFSVRFAVGNHAKLAATPTIIVSETEGLEAGDQITVWGEGFAPTAHVGTRPPLAGQPAGNYVVFGRFAENWRPSQGAASSTRTVVNQRWALPLASRLIVDPNQTDASYVELSSTGTFKAVLTVGTTALNPAGNYGVYTYAGSGATNADHELAELITLD